MVSQTVDEYIASFPAEVSDRLARIRAIILSEAPEAVESIAYGMPTYSLNGTLLHMAAFSKHLGLYAAWPSTPELQQQCQAYASGKGTLQFPYRQALPESLIREVICDRVRTQRALA